MNEREQYEIEQECELHQYFVLKHGPRITSFKVPKAQVGNIETFIKCVCMFGMSESKWKAFVSSLSV